jgi:stage II sporulation protein D
MRPAAAATRLQVYSRPSSYDLYRGVVRIYLGTTARVVNEVGLDLYLRGVVPAEMPATWPIEALKAQAIAARSYAARRLRPGISNYDVVDDTRAQVYLGVRGEKPATNVAIAATAGIVLRSGTSIANALFHSTGGGATENNENVFVAASGLIVAGPVSYLRGSSDRAPDGTSYDAAAPFATWQTAAYTGDQLSAIFANDARTSVGALTALDLSNRGVSGRLIRVTLVGALGSKTVSGDVFRSVFNAWRPATEPQLRSSLFDTQPIP